MGKKVFFSIIAGIAALGLLLSLVGFSLGGRPGSMTARDGKWIFHNSREEFILGDAPYWASNFSVFSLGFNGLDFLQDLTPYNYDDYDYDYEGDDDTGEYDDDGDYDYGFDEDEDYTTFHNQTTSAFGPINMDLLFPAEVSPQKQTITIDKNQIQHIKMDISAGYLQVKSGDALELIVDGPLAVEQSFQGKTLELNSRIRTSHRDGFRTSPYKDGDVTRFYLNGKDVTTTYTLVIPKDMKELALSLRLGIGSSTIDDLTLVDFQIDSDLSAIRIQNVQSDHVRFDLDLGQLVTKNTTTNKAQLSVSLGQIDFNGNIKQLLEADSELGNITVQIPRPTAYSWKASANLGTIQIDTQKISGKKDRSSSDTKDLHFDLETELGEINISFTE